jgi:di/tricarboxylate transporter
VRNDIYMRAPRPGTTLRAGDILVLEADMGALTEVLSRLDLRLEEDKRGGPVGQDVTEQKDGDSQDAQEWGEADDPAAGAEKPDESAEKPGTWTQREEAALMEMAVLPESRIVGNSASDLALRIRFGINLLAVARQGVCTRARLRSLKIQPGDVLLMQGSPEALSEFANSSACVPLAQRELHIPDKRKALMASGIMFISVALAALGFLPAAVSFAAGVLASMALRTVPLASAYEAVDCPVVVLLGALLPVAGAMQSTGAADFIARLLLENVAQGNALVGLAVIMVTTMILTDLMNNAATAAVMAPIGLGAAVQLGVNPDTFLMAVAIGSSCAFLTPIGHQNNTLILGPGGFSFGDYWRMGLPTDLLVITVSLPLLVWFWPL